MAGAFHKDNLSLHLRALFKKTTAVAGKKPLAKVAWDLIQRLATEALGPADIAAKLAGVLAWLEARCFGFSSYPAP